MALTQKGILAAKPGRHADGNGLYLNATTAGKSWVFRFESPATGKRREMGIGAFPIIGLADAREAALSLQKQVKGGIDPIDARNAAKAVQNVPVVKTFEQVAADYIAMMRASWRNSKHADQWTATLKTYAYPIIGKMTPDAIGTREVLAVLTPIWTTKTETASRVRSRIELILNYAKTLGLRTGENPATWRNNLDGALPKPRKVAKVKHRPSLPYAKCPSFMARLQQAQGFGARALEFVILTASRSTEVREAVWSEFDLDAGVWTVPGNRMKARKEHSIPLSSQAVQLLRDLPRLENSQYVFPGMKGNPTVSDMTLTATIRRFNREQSVWVDPERDNEEIVPHGFRSSFRVWAADSGQPRELAEAALAHSLDKVESAYQRSTMVERRRPLMQAWADFCYRN